MTRFLDNSTTEHEEKRDEPINKSITETIIDDYPVIPSQPCNIGPNTRIEIQSQHYTDSHTRPHLNKQQFNNIFSKLNDRLNIPDSPTLEHIKSFNELGYVELHDIIPADICDALSNRVDICLDGKFDTNNYPDEWYDVYG